MLRKMTILASLLLICCGLTLVGIGCEGVDNSVSVQPENTIDISNEPVEVLSSGCIDLPDVLPDGVDLRSVKESLLVRSNLHLNVLTTEVLEYIGTSFQPDEYYIDSDGLHWGLPKRQTSQSSLGSCYRPYGFSIVGSFHFVYWFNYRPPSYDASMAWIPIYAQEYDRNGILVQKRDICLICGCNPFCALLWTRICAK